MGQGFAGVEYVLGLLIPFPLSICAGGRVAGRSIAKSNDCWSAWFQLGVILFMMGLSLGWQPEKTTEPSVFGVRLEPSFCWRCNRRLSPAKMGVVKNRK